MSRPAGSASVVASGLFNSALGHPSNHAYPILLSSRPWGYHAADDNPAAVIVAKGIFHRTTTSTRTQAIPPIPHPLCPQRSDLRDTRFIGADDATLSFDPMCVHAYPSPPILAVICLHPCPLPAIQPVAATRYSMAKDSSGPLLDDYSWSCWLLGIPFSFLRNSYRVVKIIIRVIESSS
jgi:hypothetical protein